MKDKFNSFFKKWSGKPCEVNDPSNLNQCMDLAYAYCDELGVPRDAIRHLYASEIWTKPNDLTIKYFEYIPNTPMGVPQVGDVIVFGGIVGHVSIANGNGDINTFESFDQNWGATVNKCGIIKHSYDNVLGFLRFKLPQPAPTITDQTILPIIDSLGHNMEVGAVRSKLADNERQITSLMSNVDALSFKIDDLQTKLDNMSSVEENASQFIKQVHSIIYNKWTWVGVNSWKIRLGQLKSLLTL